MCMQRAGRFLVLFLGAALANLSLRTSDPSIQFGARRPASLRATCDSEPAFVAALTPNLHTPYLPPSNLTVELGNVPTTCINLPIEIPCARHDSSLRPPLFYARLSGEQGSILVGPTAAYTKEYTSTPSNQVLGIAVHATWELPDIDLLLSLTHYTGDGSPMDLNVSITHFEPTSEWVEVLPFRGEAGGNVIRLHELPTPPTLPLPNPPPSPSLPPSPPDVATCNSGSSWQHTSLRTMDNLNYASSSHSNFGSSYRPTNTINSNPSSFYLSSGPSNQWIVYESTSASPVVMRGIRIQPGQSPYGLRTFRFEYGDSRSGPWTIATQGTVGSCASAGNCIDDSAFTVVASVFWRCARSAIDTHASKQHSASCCPPETDAPPCAVTRCPVLTHTAPTQIIHG